MTSPDSPPQPSPQKRPWWRRPITIASAVVVVLLVAGGVTAFAIMRPTTAAARTYTVSTGTVEQTVSATGTLEPANQANLSFASSGTVQTVDVKVGDTVTVGQTLATIDPSTLQADVDLAQATLAQAQTQVSAASGSTAVAAAAAQLASAQAKLALAQSALTGATMTSPIAGIVASVSLTPGTAESGANGATGSSSTGSTGSTGSSSRGATGSTGGTGSTGSTGSAGSSSAQITVISPTAWVVDASVGSSDLATLKPGLQAQITPTGARQTLFGTVQTIGIVATSSGTGAATFPVTIAVTGAQSGLYSGTTASVSIVVKQLDNVLAVPTLAVSSSNGRTTVTVRKNGRDSSVPVTVGAVYGAQTQITSGLGSGDVIVLPSFTGTGTGTTGTTGRGFGGGGFGGGGFGGGGGQGGGGQGGGTGGGTNTGGKG